MITYRITHKYSTLDKCHQFGIEMINDSNTSLSENFYNQWVWFHLGSFLMDKPININLYPFSVNIKTKYNFKNCNDAERQAKMIYKLISKHDKIHVSRQK
jgi:hypothetical protein